MENYVNFANLAKEEFLTKAYFEDKEISLKQSLTILVEKIKATKEEDILFYKGAGNLGVMQNSVKTFLQNMELLLQKVVFVMKLVL